VVDVYRPTDAIDGADVLAVYSHIDAADVAVVAADVLYPADVVGVYRPKDAVDGADVRPICSPYIGI